MGIDSETGMNISLKSRLTILFTASLIISTFIVVNIFHRATEIEFTKHSNSLQPNSKSGQQDKQLLEEIDLMYSYFGYKACDYIKTINSKDKVLALIDQNDQVKCSNHELISTSQASMSAHGIMQIMVIQNHMQIDFSIENPSLIGSSTNTDNAWLVIIDGPIIPANGADFAWLIWGQIWWKLLLILFILTLLIHWAIKLAMSPISQLTHAVSKLQHGSFPEKIVAKSSSGEINALLETFNAATQALEETDTIKKHLVSDIAHELRTPLTNIKSLFEAKQAGLITNDADFYNTVSSEIADLEQLVTDFLQLSLSDSGKIKLNTVSIDLIEYLHALFESAAINYEIATSTKIKGPVFIRADEFRLRQVFNNLIENSLKAQSTHLMLTITECSNNLCQLSFSDNGLGIEPKDAQYIFERFYRADKSRNKATGGSGLGLTIAKGLIEAMSGSIELDSSYTDGAAFIITLPTIKNISLQSRLCLTSHPIC